MLENKDALTDMVKRSGAHSTDLQEKESAADLCAKCHTSIEAWTPVAQRLWEDPADPMAAKRRDAGQGLADTDMEKLSNQGRTRTLPR